MNYLCQRVLHSFTPELIIAVQSQKHNSRKLVQKNHGYVSFPFPGKNIEEWMGAPHMQAEAMFKRNPLLGT